MKEQLKKRLRYLWTFELANALVTFPGFYVTLSLRYHLGWFSLLALGMVSLILLVGAYFWFLKLRALDGSDHLSRRATHRFFRASKIVFGVVLAGLVALFITRIATQTGTSRADTIIGGALLFLAVLEYVNYYFVQLMYDTRADINYLLKHRKLKRATMVRDLDI